MSDDLDPVHRALAEEARAIEPRIQTIRFLAGLQRPLMVIEIFDVPAEITRRLQQKLKRYRELNNVECDVSITRSSTPEFQKKIEIPEGWPPEG